MSLADLELTIRYRDKIHILPFSADSVLPQTFGRADFQRWFGLPGDALLNISKTHFSVAYQHGRFWIDEHSKYGTLVRCLDDPVPPPYKRRLRARLALCRRTELKLTNSNRADGKPDDVYIIVDYPGASDTLAVFVDPLWDQLLRRLESTRSAHLIGLPGSGKWYLARQLMAEERHGHDRERVLGDSTLPVSVDCRAIAAGEEGSLWLALARRLLLALGEAADRYGYRRPSAAIAGLVAQFDRQPPGQPEEAMNYFQRAFETLVTDALQSPLLLLTNFDAIYSDLEPEMLYCLARFGVEWHPISERIFLVIATWRPLGRLRDDGAGSDANEFVREFNRIFSDSTIVLNYSGQFLSLWDSLTDGRPLEMRNEDLLLRLTGANPGLLRDLLQRLQMRRWLDDPASLSTRLRQVDWAAEPPLPTCDKIWRVLRPDERDCLVTLAAGQPIDINQQQELTRLGLVNADGRIFSEIFAATVGRFRAEEDRHERGLRVDPANRRVTVDGRPVALKDGREMDVLLALYQRRGDFVPYRQLIEAVYGEPGRPYDDSLIANDKEALQKAVARLCERIDPQRAYILTKHGYGYILSAAVG